jgi:uncharacterized protein (TIGR03083 family)
MRAMIADERRQAADLIDTLSPEQLRAPSLCSAWTVHAVAAHLLAPLVSGLGGFVWMVLKSGLDPHRANIRLACALADARSGAEIAAGLREHAEYDFRPPVVGRDGPFTDLLVHGQDIRRPLGIPHQFRPERLRLSLDFLVSGSAKGFVPKELRSGDVRYEATDLGWSWGSGPVVRGPGEAVLMVLTGRTVALDDAEGDGVEVLRRRLHG